MVTEKNHIIYHNNMQTYLENKEVKPVEPVTGKHCKSRIPESPQGKKLLTQTSLQHLKMVTEKNHIIYHNNMQTYLENKEVKPVEPVQMNIYQINNYRKDLSWLYFNDGTRVQERCNSPTYLILQLIYFQVAARITSPGMATKFHASSYVRFIEIESNLWKKETSQNESKL